ncbi:hypothetical protein Pelo_4682 [Pelomyxa schiedti]|nr:hypothetical protein Pelo_4682 [Pelomyxa schiedti]
MGKARCAQWLLDSFDIPLVDVIEMAKGYTLHINTPSEMNLLGWKMLLRKYPGIGAEVIQANFMPFLALSPHIAIWTMHEYGLTLSQVRDFCSTATVQNNLNHDVVVWLQNT